VTPDLGYDTCLLVLYTYDCHGGEPVSKNWLPLDSYKTIHCLLSFD